MGFTGLDSSAALASPEPVTGCPMKQEVCASPWGKTTLVARGIGERVDTPLRSFAVLYAIAEGTPC